MKDLRQQLTVFLVTVGDEPNFTNARICLDSQTVSFERNVIDRVTPLHEALNQMLRRCQTPYFIQVDEDMMLFPNAVEALYERISTAPENVALVAAPLWDCDLQRPIHGVKIYRHDVVARFPYRDTSGCDIRQLDDLREAGFVADEMPLAPWNCLGEHGKYYSPETIFDRWWRLVIKHRRNRNISWVAPWPRRLAERYRETGSEHDLWALLGVAAAIAGELPPSTSHDFSADRKEFQRLNKYFQPGGVPSPVQPALSTRVVSRLLRLLSRCRRLWR